MANKKRSNNLQASLETVRQINWFDGIHKLPINVNKNLLDQCSDIIQEFIDGNGSLPTKRTKSPKRQGSKIKKAKVTKIKQIKSKQMNHKIKPKVKTLKKPFNISSTNGYPCYPSAFPCFRSCGPINCPKNKLPMPRDLWYRIVYSQALEQQLGNGEAFIHQNRSVSRLRSSSKRKHPEDESQTEKSNSNNSRRQQTMNAAFSSTKIIKLDADDHLHKTVDNLEYIAETLPLDMKYKPSQSNLMHAKIESKENLETTLWNTIPSKTVLITQSAHAELTNPRKIHRGISADGTLEQITNISSTPSAPIILTNFEEQIPTQQPMDEITNENSSIEHPLINQLIEYYNLHDIPRFELSKRLNRRLTHIHQTLETMSSNDIEIKLKYKRDALVKKRHTPVQSLTKDERIAMAELELNVYEYVKILDEPPTQCFRVNNNNEFEVEELPATAPISPSYDTVLPVVKSTLTYESSITPSISTFNTIRPSVISHSTALLSTVTQFSGKTEKFLSWNHPFLPNLTNIFEPLTPVRKAQIHKQLARRYEHICKKAKELNSSQLQKQINSKSKAKVATMDIYLALEQNKNILQPNEDDHLRIAELELCLFELEKEQTQRTQLD